MIAPNKPSGVCPRKTVARCAVIAAAGRWSGSLPGSSTSGGSWCVTNLMRKTFRALSIWLPLSSSCDIYEMASSKKRLEEFQALAKLQLLEKRFMVVSSEIETWGASSGGQ